ncbi:MAG: hypothetical protein IT209_00135 [Armatimonadetes bacterium]|nr:hypothetical protein [Armatimonadota bacterium]
MKLAIIIYDTGAESLVEEALEEVGASAWTRVTDVVGKGRTGLRMGDPVFPGVNNVMLCVIEDEQVEPLRQRLLSVPDEFIKQLAFRVFISDCEVLV